MSSIKMDNFFRGYNFVSQRDFYWIFMLHLLLFGVVFPFYSQDDGEVIGISILFFIFLILLQYIILFPYFLFVEYFVTSPLLFNLLLVCLCFWWRSSSSESLQHHDRSALLCLSFFPLLITLIRFMHFSFSPSCLYLFVIGLKVSLYSW